MQAALVQAAKHWERIETSPEAYVRRTMYHQNISWWRRRKLAETPLQSYDAPAPRPTRPAAHPRAGPAPAHPAPAHRAGAALLRGPHRGPRRRRARASPAARSSPCRRQALARLRVLAPELADLVGSRRMSDDLRTTLPRIADSAPPLPVGDDLWQRGRDARRRGQAFAIAAVLALVVSVGGIATVTATNDREARTASNEDVEGGAIPSGSRTSPTTSDHRPRAGRARRVHLELGRSCGDHGDDGLPHRLDLPGWDRTPKRSRCPTTGGRSPTRTDPPSRAPTSPWWTSRPAPASLLEMTASACS